MVQRNTAEGPVKTLDTTFGIIETLRDVEDAGVSEIAAELGVANSTAHDHLSTLRERGYVVKEGQRYRLSLRFLEVGAAVRRNHPLSAVSRRPLRELAEQTGEIAWLITEENGYAVHLRKSVGSHAVQTHGRVGRHPHMHYLAAGKAILAHLPAERREAILDRHGLPAQTENTITDRDELDEVLAGVRERGYAFNDEETYQGLRCIGAPIIPDGEEVVGAISVCGPANRFIGERFRRELPETLLGYTNEIELRLSH